ncbi:hypothetical protein Baya_11809 [Bagarius yarrelli]|uniref:Ig-like domain-containing protein n=1 Tax=Bagarius yarrelli TaxID=175774 RepID=A0A556V166_BAGYA|nr:hypothetical protein Baya_11809 [Bagarius yarrelli]
MDSSTLALELRNLLENDTGSYTLTLHTDTVPVSSVTIVRSQTELVEFNSTVSLVCSASGSSLSFLWLNVSSVVTADKRIQLTDNKSECWRQRSVQLQLSNGLFEEKLKW